MTLAYLRYLWAQATQAHAKRRKPFHPIPADALAIIHSMLPAESAILCLGARNQQEPHMWREFGYSDVTAVDLLPSRGVSFGDMHRLSFADARFSLVHASHVLEHAFDPGRAVKEVCRVLRPGGIIYAAWPRHFVPSDHDRIDYGSASAFRAYVASFCRAELLWREDAATESKALVRIG